MAKTEMFAEPELETKAKLAVDVGIGVVAIEPWPMPLLHPANTDAIARVPMRQLSWPRCAERVMNRQAMDVGTL